MPVDYDALFGGGAMAAHYALQDRDMEREQKQGTIRQQELANMFAEQNNPLKLQEQQMRIEDQGYTNRQNKIKTTQEEELAPFKLDDEKKKFILGAKRSDLDMMQLEAQRMAYSPDPETSAEGQRMLQLHRDFIKLREQGEQKKELVDQRTQGQITLEGVKQPNRIQLKQIAPGKASGGGGGSGKPSALTTDKLAAQYTQQMAEALAKGDQAAAENANAMLSRIEAYKAAQKADTGAGKTVLTPEGTFGTAPPRAAPSVPAYIPPNGAAPTKPAPASLASVQKMYPGVPADKLREAYKKKFGVDLK